MASLVDVHIDSAGRAFVVAEDTFYDVEDPESRRTFAIVHATPGLDNSGIDFEEL
jgi:hypothetical protein